MLLHIRIFKLSLSQKIDKKHFEHRQMSIISQKLPTYYIMPCEERNFVSMDKYLKVSER